MFLRLYLFHRIRSSKCQIRPRPEFAIIRPRGSTERRRGIITFNTVQVCIFRYDVVQARDHVKDLGIARLRITRKNVRTVVRTFREDVCPSSPIRSQTNFGVTRVEGVDQGTTRTKQVLLDGLMVEAVKRTNSV